MQYRDDLNNVTSDPIGYNVRCTRDDEFAGAGHATRSAEGRHAAKRVTAARIRSIMPLAAVGLFAATCS